MPRLRELDQREERRETFASSKLNSDVTWLMPVGGTVRDFASCFAETQISTLYFQFFLVCLKTDGFISFRAQAVEPGLNWDPTPFKLCDLVQVT